jgi:MFS family permease
MPALLTFLIRLFVPESDKWEEEQKAGTTSQWSTVDLIGVLIGAAVGAGVLSIWLTKWDLSIRILGTLVGVVLITFCFLHPARQYMFRIGMPIAERRRTVRRLLLAAGLSGVPLVATWGGVMWVYNWVDELTRDPITKLITNPDAKPITQAASAFGAAMGCVLAAWLGNVIGRKPAYAILCVGSAVSLFSFYRFNTEFNVVFVVTAGLVGFVTASFYGWLPLYLPELFRTGMRATGQGFGFNFGRILASVGSLQTGALLQAFDGNYAKACSAAAAVYGLGLVLIAFAPETRGKPLPD